MNLKRMYWQKRRQFDLASAQNQLSIALITTFVCLLPNASLASIELASKNGHKVHRISLSPVLAMHPCSAESIQAALGYLRQFPRRKELRKWKSHLIDNCQPSDVATLRFALEGEDNWRIKKATLLALGEIGGESAVEWLGQMLLSQGTGTQQQFLRRSAAEALGNLSTSEATAKLIAALPQEQDSDIRRIITEQLGQAPDAASADILLTVLKTDESNLARKSAASALSQLKTPVIPALADGLKVSELETRYWSLMALVQMDNPDAMDAIEATSIDVQALLDAADEANLMEGDRAPSRAVQQAGIAQLKGQPVICKQPWIARHWSRCS